MKQIYLILMFIGAFLWLAPEMNPLQAQWSTDPNVNTLVTNAEEDQNASCIITDGQGGVIIAWRDYQFNNSIFGGDIMAQRLNNGGGAMWTSNGIVVNAASLGKGHFAPVMTEDGYGGAVIGWGRTPGFVYNYDIFAQKVNADGTRLWAANDVTISDRSGTESFHQIVSDDSCGAILTWTHLPGTPGSTDIYAQRVDSAGNNKWANNGAAICMAAASQSYPQLTGDGNSGAIITWADSRNGGGGSDIYAQRIAHDGTVLWTTDGVEVSNYLNSQIFPVIVTDGEGGAIIVWEDSRAGNSDIYAQRLNSSGEFQWSEHGIPVCSAPGNQQRPVIVSDGEGGAIITWQDDRNGSHDIYAQRINGSGEMQWTIDGVAATIAPDDQSAPIAISDNANGIIITWWDHRSDPLGDIYAQRINAQGTRLWNENGTAVCTASGDQEYPVLASDGDEGAIIVWSDKRNGTDYDIYAQLIDKAGNLGIFVDDDLDGIGDTEEQGPNGDNPDYDGNSDGFPDYQQANVASFNTFDQGQYVTLAVPEPAILKNVQATDNPDPDAQGAPEEGTYPYGFFSFSITGLVAGGNTIATLFLHDGPEVNRYYKYGPTPTDGLKWYDFDYDGETGAVISEDAISLHLTDGLRGDFDITADGIIIEPGGPIKDAITTIREVTESEFVLEQNYPNPFTGQTKISYQLNSSARVVLSVFNLLGKEVKILVSQQMPPGKHEVIWDGRDDSGASLDSGIYFYRMEVITKSGNITKMKRMMLMK